MNKYLKNTIGASLLVGAMAFSLVSTPKLVMAHETGCSFSEIASYSAFEKELSNLSFMHQVTFQNNGLYDLLNEQSGNNLSVDYLRSVTHLCIEGPLSNNDLSDLKYLPNLEALEIKGMDVDCYDLKYNQNLYTFRLEECSLSNTSELPNTIRTLCIQGSTVSDNVISVPYHTTSLNTEASVFNKIVFKNPSVLKEFVFSGYAIFDINDLKNASNLSYIRLSRCPNVKNGALLRGFSNLNCVELDEYACIWMDKETLDSLSIDGGQKEKFSSYMGEIDEIVGQIIKDGMSDKECLDAIIIYIIQKIEYDEKVENERTGYKILVTNYNDEPISYSLHSDIGICVNYASLFTAIANRVHLDSYQPRNESHTWNMVRFGNTDSYKGYDLTALDNMDELTYEMNLDALGVPTSFHVNDSEKLYYYGFDVNSLDYEAYETKIKPMIIHDFVEKLGYLDSHNFQTFQAQMYVLVAELAALLVGLSIHLRLSTKKEDKNTRVLKYKRVENK